MIEPGELVRHEPAQRVLTVTRTTTLSPGFRRLTVTGDELRSFVSLGAGDHVKVILDEETRRDYTPRFFRAPTESSGPELDIDFFLHGSGRATTWATAAKEGDTVRIGGPRGSRLPPTGASRVMLGADESSLPALARWIEMLPRGIEIHAFVTLDNSEDAAYLEADHLTRARVTWFDKSPGLLEQALRDLATRGELDEHTFVWLAGEATSLIPVRRYLRHELALHKNQLKIDGYWKSGEAGRDHHAPIDASDPDD